MSRLLILVCFVAIIVNVTCTWEYETTTYDCFTSEPATEEAIAKYKEENNAYVCTKEIKNCDPNEYRRVDGSCNNLNNPAVGAFNTPMIRLLPADFGENNTVKTAENGEPLTPERKCRTELLGDGKASHPYLTMYFGHIFICLYADCTTVHDTLNFLSNTTNCCTPEGKDNPNCAPLKVPGDDPVHRHSGIRCMNQTKPLTFQYYGCAGQDTEPTRIGNNTHLFDLSTMYNALNIEELRTYEGGQMKYEVIDGVVLPPNGTTTGRCLANSFPEDSYCMGNHSNGILGPTLCNFWFYRLHNLMAADLAVINPCWSDELLFHKTRQMIIAMWQKIHYYDVLTLVLGREYMIKAGIISPYPGFRNLYNPNLSPSLSVEFGYTGRYFHATQEGTVEYYDEDGEYCGEASITNFTLRTGAIVKKKTIEMITRGSIRQLYGNVDRLADPAMTETGLSTLQDSTDILTNDLSKGRHVGLPPYIHYVRLFNPHKTYNCFEDLREFIDDDSLRRLKKLYSSVEMIDLMAGLWAEKPLSNLACTPTLRHIMSEQLHRHVRTDRFWFENGEQPNALNWHQLQEVRRMNPATLLCTVGDGITEVQPNPFIIPGPGNEIRSCDEIRKINLSAWKDHTCQRKKNKANNNRINYWH